MTSLDDCADLLKVVVPEQQRKEWWSTQEELYGHGDVPRWALLHEDEQQQRWWWGDERTTAIMEIVVDVVGAQSTLPRAM